MSPVPIIIRFILFPQAILAEVMSTQIEQPWYHFFRVPYAKAYGTFKFVVHLVDSTWGVLQPQSSIYVKYFLAISSLQFYIIIKN